ncbi:MAG: YggS family pyridoxal phosphate-dependent enzyme [Verrucomicrobia bacterium]|nr:YggS family pyridoxal phosphate-dependent enzyme [Verrucomicrobiota bacterium]
MSELQENLTRIRSRIDQACERSGRQPDSVRLMAVSKNQPPERVAEAASAGLTLFGENRIQEAKVKIAQCPSQLEWHFIGHLQSNKSRDAVSLFQVVQGVDSLALAEELQKQAIKQARSLPILLEVNVAGESSKFGWKPDRLLAELLQLNALPRLEVQGLMTIAPYAVDPEQVRPIFRRLRELRDRCTDLLGAPLPVLSMGMSGDLEVAIEEGATLVRVGTALFGERPRRSDADNPPDASDSVG